MLDAATLAREAYVRPVRKNAPPRFSDRIRFYPEATGSMRRILTDDTRKKKSERRVVLVMTPNNACQTELPVVSKER
jgi:hypothetical protein